jgi:hypothetical protein
MCPHADNPAIERSPRAEKATTIDDARVRLMLAIQPATRPIIHRAFHRANGEGAASMLDVARDATEREFEIARVMRIARSNRHAETEE